MHPAPPPPGNSLEERKEYRDTMLTHMLHAYDLQLNLASMLVKDIPDDQMCAQPHGLVNHPTWNLGHLVLSEHHTCKLLDIDSTLPDGWDKLFKAGGTPGADRSAYPGKAELLAELGKMHERMKAALPGIAAETLDREHPSEDTRKYFPTIGAMVAFIMTSHEMDHLGQIAAWRRAAGLGPAS